MVMMAKIPPPVSAQKVRGKIMITFRANKIEAKFEGDVKGRDLDLALRALVRDYRRWKHSLMKEGK